MHETYEITLEVDGEEIPVTLEEPGMLTRLKLGKNAPSLDQDASIEEIVNSENITDFITQMVEEVSDFPPVLIDDLPPEAFDELIGACSDVVAGKDPTEKEASFRHNTGDGNPFGNLDLNSDGTTDLDDWR